MWLEGGEGEERAQGKVEAEQAWESAGPCSCTQSRREQESGFDSESSGKLRKHFKEDGEVISLGSEKPPF